MTQQSANATKTKPRAKRIAGICDAAKKCGVTRGHLWAVLTNRRESQPLLARYQALRKEAAKKFHPHVERYATLLGVDNEQVLQIVRGKSKDAGLVERFRALRKTQTNRISLKELGA